MPFIITQKRSEVDNTKRTAAIIPHSSSSRWIDSASASARCCIQASIQPGGRPNPHRSHVRNLCGPARVHDFLYTSPHATCLTQLGTLPWRRSLSLRRRSVMQTISGRIRCYDIAHIPIGGSLTHSSLRQELSTAGTWWSVATC